MAAAAIDCRQSGSGNYATARTQKRKVWKIGEKNGKFVGKLSFVITFRTKTTKKRIMMF